MLEVKRIPTTAGGRARRRSLFIATAGGFEISFLESVSAGATVVGHVAGASATVAH
jgi:hypothetical protein